MNDSSNTVFHRDFITDFQHGIDKIDLHNIDSNMNKAGNQDFQFVAYDPKRPLQAGEVTAVYDPLFGNTFVMLANDVAPGVDMIISLNGNVPIDRNDFIL